MVASGGQGGGPEAGLGEGGGADAHGGAWRVRSFVCSVRWWRVGWPGWGCLWRVFGAIRGPFGVPLGVVAP